MITAISKITFFEGLNIYSPKPAIRMVLQCDDAHPERLQSVQNSIFSIVANVEAAAGAAEGGDSSRRVAPSGLPELVARVAQNLQSCLGHEIDNVMPVQGRNISVFGYRYAKIGVLAGRAAIGLINAVLDSSGGNAGSDAEANLQGRFDKFRELAAPLDCGAIVNRVVTESIARDIPWFRIFPEQLTIQLGQGRKLQRFRETFTRNTSFIATEIARNKNAASRLFLSHGIPAAANSVAVSKEQAIAAANQLGFPVVIKPNTTDFGIAVRVNLRDAEEVESAFQSARKHGAVLVEKHIPGDHYRITVMHGKTVFVRKQKPAHVIADGQHTIAQLIDIENEDRTDKLSDYKNKIKLDEDSIWLLKENNYALTDIPPAETEIFLRTQSNLSQGGTLENVTSITHPENIAMAERAARLVGLDVAGVDFITHDISQPFYATGGAICEINPSPGMRGSRGREAEAALLDEFFPPGDDGRIPIAAITGSFATVATARALADILSHAGSAAGIATAEEARIDGVRIGKGDFSGIRGCKAILRDSSVGAAVLGTSFAHIIEQGFGFDRCNVSAVIASPDENGGGMAAEAVVKSKQLAVAAANNMAVIDAGDPHFDAMQAGAGGTPICVVSLDPKHANAIRHIEYGGIAILLGKQQGDHALNHWQAGNLVGSYTPDIIPVLKPGASVESLTGACFACGLALGLDVKIVR